MTTYAIGDIQGCFEPFQCLLQQVHFDPEKDQLWVAGDMVNRGPDSLGTLRYIHELGDAAQVVLGNHDLHLLAIYHQLQPMRKGDTLEAILNAPDGDTLLEWLSKQPLVHHDKVSGYSMVHAGIPPQFSLPQALSLSAEVEAMLQSSKREEFLQNMYGNEPNNWHEQLDGFARLRCITNYFTRMRFCTADGTLDMKNKGNPANATAGMLPWFEHKCRKMRDQKIIFGHWAALRGEVDQDNLYALDTGCVWGERLTLMRLGDEKLFYCEC